LVKVLHHSVTSKSHGGLSVAYAPPEFHDGKTTRWSDQYSLAVSHCLLRGGALPFEGSAVQVASGDLLRPPDLSMLPEYERPGVARALAKEPSQRWESCREFVRALGAAARVVPAVREVRPIQPSPAPRDVRPVQPSPAPRDVRPVQPPRAPRVPRTKG